MNNYTNDKKTKICNIDILLITKLSQKLNTDGTGVISNHHKFFFTIFSVQGYYKLKSTIKRHLFFSVLHITKLITIHLITGPEGNSFVS